MPITLTEYNINDLDSLPNRADLVTKFLEVADANGKTNNKVSFVDFAQEIINSAPGGNNSKSLYKTARTYDTTDPNYVPGFPTLVGLNADFLAGGALCWVEFPQPSREYRLMYDPNGPVRAYTSGEFVGQKLNYRWIEKTEADQLIAGFADFNPFTSEYKQGDSVKFKLAGIIRLFSARQKLTKSSWPTNLIPEPTGSATDANWTEISAQSSPNDSTGGQIACRFRFIAESQVDPYGGDSLEAVTLRNNNLYTNRTATVELGPNAGTYRVVYEPTSPEFFAYVDGSLSGGKNPCKWALVEEAKPAVTPWVAGPQKANSLVLYNGNVYRVKSDITNGQSAPAGNTQYYQPIGQDGNAAQLVGGNSFQDAQFFQGNGASITLDSGTIFATADNDVASTIITPGQVALYSNGNRQGRISATNSALVLEGSNVQVAQDPTQPLGVATKGYVDAANALANADAARANSRLDTLVENAPQALNTLKEISDQLTADEQGTAAILATQQQHTQQLADVLTLSTTQIATGAKTFTQPLTIGTTSGSNSLNVWSNSSDTNVFIASLLAPNVRDNVFLTIGSQSGSNGQSALFGFSRENGIPAAFFTNYGRPASDFKILGTNGNIGMGTTSPSERLEVNGNVKATKFIGDGSQLANLPTTPVEQNLTSNSTTAAPSVAAVVASYRNNLTAISRDANQTLDARQGKVLDDKIAAVNNNIRPTVAIMDPFAQTTFQQGYYYVYNDILWLRTGATVSDSASNVLYVGSPGWKDTLGYNIYDGLISYGDRSLSNDSRWVKYQVGVSNQRAIKGQIWYLNGNAYRYINNVSSIGVAQIISGPDEFANQTLWENVIGGGVVPQNLKNIVRNGTFTNGELQGTQPQNSVSNAKFTDANYRYEYTYAAADTNGTQFVWVRTQKA